MPNNKNYIHFYNHPDNNRVTVEVVKLSYILNNFHSIQSFLGGDIQTRENCLDYLGHIFKAKKDPNYFYDSFGNCCTITITHRGVTIENEYTKEIAKDIKLDDIKIILEKWLEFITTREPIEYSW